MTDYRAFGECQKAVMQTNDFFDFAQPIGSKVINATKTVVQYQFAHINVLTNANVTFGLDKDAIGSAGATYTMDLVAGQQIAGVSKLAVNSGIVQALFLL